MNAFAVSAAPLLAEIDLDNPPSFAAWALSSLGFFGLLIPFFGFAILIGACVVVARCRPPAIAAFLLFVPLPLMMAVFATAKGMVAAFSVIALSEIELKTSQIAGGLAETALLLIVGMLATIPSYLVIAVGLFVRTLVAGNESSPDGSNRTQGR